MLINHRTAQVGVVNQKRPQIWQSAAPMPKQQEHMGAISATVGSHTLATLLYGTQVAEDTSKVSVLIGNQTLTTFGQMTNVSEETTKVSVAVGDQSLISMVHDASVEETTAQFSIAVGNQSLYIASLRAEETDADNLKLGVSIGDQQLNEE